MQGSVNCSYIPDPQWEQLPLAGITPIGDTIYIWHGITANLLIYYDACYAIATDNERATAARFYHEANQKRYIIHHSVLRLLLGRYTGLAAAEIIFSYNENKKPYLQNKTSVPCYFNLSHSADDFLIAIGPEELGVDIEQINARKHWEDIASNYFGIHEVAHITNAPNPDAAFFQFWTRKEAFLKATGTGIDDNLPEISAMDGKQPIPADYPAVDWMTQSFTVSPTFQGAITYPAPQKNVRLLKLGAGPAGEFLRLA